MNRQRFWQRMTVALRKSKLQPMQLLGSRSCRVLSLTLALLAGTAQLDAKCGWLEYTIHLAVRSSRSGLPIQAASLTFFAGSDPDVWIGVTDRGDGGRYVTDSEGHFDGVFHFGTSSGSFFGMDRCNRKLKNLTVVVTAPGYQGQRLTYPPDRLIKRSGDPWQFQLQLPPVELSPR